MLQRNPPQVVLESGKHPGELVTVDKSGKMASDTRGGNFKLASRRFTVYVKVSLLYRINLTFIAMFLLLFIHSLYKHAHNFYQQ